MSRESEFIDSLRPLAGNAAARGLEDDAAILEVAAGTLVLTCDTLVESVHYRPDDPPADVAWKLIAVNLSDLAAKGARPIGVLLSYALGPRDWDAAFVAGLATALNTFDLPLLGGDTVAMPEGAPRALTLTAIGGAAGPVPSRAGARPGDRLWVSGTIGDSGAGLRALMAGRDEPAGLIERYRNPRPRIEAGQRLAPIVRAMMDVSDGLLIDAKRMAEASGCRAVIGLDDIPRSEALIGIAGVGLDATLGAATAGDDYELLFAAAAERTAEILALAAAIGMPLSPIGAFEAGSGLSLTLEGKTVSLPRSLGYEHGAKVRSG